MCEVAISVVGGTDMTGTKSKERKDTRANMMSGSVKIGFTHSWSSSLLRFRFAIEMLQHSK